MSEYKPKWESYGSEVPVQNYLVKHSLRLNAAQKQLIELTAKQPMSRMMGAPEEIQLLANLCKLIRAKKTLDIGVYTGYSSLSIAQVLPPDGTVYAFDVSEEYTNIGKPIWKEAGVYDKIKLTIGPAVDSLQKLVDDGQSGTFDYAFIDADKPNYDTYYELCLKLVRSGGIIAIDNVLWGKSVIDPDNQEPSTRSIRTLNTKIRDDNRVDVSMIFIGDGVTLAFKK